MTGKPGDAAGARTPEELETLLEDALVLRDGTALTALFGDGAVLIAGDARPARRGEEIARLALATWQGDRTHVADPRRVVQARDVALVVAPRGINVACRGRDSAWRYAIVLQPDDQGADGRAGSRKEQAMTQDTSHTQALTPVVVAKDEGEARWWFGSLAVIKAAAADTGGRLTIVEVTEPPGAEGPLRVHHREDEGFWLLEGDATFEVGETTIEAHAGDYVFGLRDVPHRYTVGDAGCRMLVIMTPGGFEDLVIAMSEPAGSRALPPPSEEEPNWERVAAIAAAHGAELLG